jgi:hypothetical protein
MLKEKLSRLMINLRRTTPEETSVKGTLQLFDFEGYPSQVKDSFLNLNDVAAVSRVYYYALGLRDEITDILLEHTHKGCLVQIRCDSFIVSVDWSNPLRIPIDYKEFGTTYFAPYGPEKIQTNRAYLLSQRLRVPLTVK